MITLGFIGCAHCHTPWIAGVLKARPDARVKAVYDHKRSRADACAAQLGGRSVSSPAEILDDPEIGGVFILSETDRHQTDVLSAVKANKALFVEKPLGLNGRDSARMARAIIRAGLPFMTGYRTRSEGIFIFLRDQIRNGGFGRITRIRYINCHDLALKGGFGPDHDWMADPVRAGGGAFLDLGTHALDSILWLMGEEVVEATSVVGAITAGAIRDSCEEFGEGLLRFASGAIGSLAAGWTDVDQPVRCVISGTEGHAHVTENRLYFKSSRVPGADGTKQFTALPPDRPLAFDIFVDSLIRGARPDFISPAEAAYVCSVQDALTLGRKKGRWVRPAAPLKP